MDGKYIKFQSIKEKIRVNGLKNSTMPKIANDRLIRKHGDYYLRIVTYTYIADMTNENGQKKRLTPDDNSVIKIDFGVGRQLTFSNGIFVEKKRRMACLHADNSCFFHSSLFSQINAF